MVKDKNPPKRRENGKQSFANKQKPKTHYFEQISYLQRTILSGLLKFTFLLHLSCLFLSLAVNQQFNYLFVISQMEVFWTKRSLKTNAKSSAKKVNHFLVAWQLLSPSGKIFSLDFLSILTEVKANASLCQSCYRSELPKLDFFSVCFFLQIGMFNSDFSHTKNVIMVYDQWNILNIKIYQNYKKYFTTLKNFVILFFRLLFVVTCKRFLLVAVCHRWEVSLKSLKNKFSRP